MATSLNTRRSPMRLTRFAHRYCYKTRGGNIVTRQFHKRMAIQCSVEKKAMFEALSDFNPFEHQIARKPLTSSIAEWVLSTK